MEGLSYRGSTSDFFRYDSSHIVKSPMTVWTGNPNHQKLEKEMERAISFERQVLERLGGHSRIDPYLGPHGNGILLNEASYGNLQAYLDSNSAAINSRCIHLWLCDFGGARCDELGSNIDHLPDDPFFDPRLPWVSTPEIDIFSLGSIIYTILTGHWPYRNGPPPVTVEDINSYETSVNQMFAAGKFPDVSMRGGNVIKGCWDHQYQTAEEVLLAIKSEMVLLDS